MLPSLHNSMTDNAPNQAREVRLPVGIKSRAELYQAIEKLYGPNVSRVLERTGAKKISVNDQKNLVAELQKAGLNGQSEEVLRLYTLHAQELGKKEMVQKKWYEKVWDGTKDVVKGIAKAVVWPFKKAGETFVKHPILTSVAVGGFLYFGLPMLLKAIGVAEGAGAGAVVEKIIEHVKTFLPFSPTAPVGPLPETLPPAFMG